MAEHTNVHALDAVAVAATRRRLRYAGELFLVCTIGLVPWTVYLGLTLPTVYRTEHWSLAWVGFDVLLMLAMAATAYLGWRGRQAVIAAALATSTLLVCDAWFDIALDLGTRQVWTSVASAVFIELPLAAFLAHRARQILRLTFGRLYAAVGGQGTPPPLYKLPLFSGWELRKEDVQDQ